MSGRTSIEGQQELVRVAMQHGRDGFFLKAVALIKQVLKMNPGLSAEREALAGWYLALSMNDEAATEYRVLLGQYRAVESADGTARIVDALGRLQASVDPDSEPN